MTENIVRLRLRQLYDKYFWAEKSYLWFIGIRGYLNGLPDIEKCVYSFVFIENFDLT